jgi:hypothetical protein
MEAGMMDGVQSRDAFEAIDPTLTMFALAHGMDLSKGEDYRRLGWFSEGLERGILIRPAEGRAFDIDIMAWRNGQPEHVTGQSAAQGTTAELLTSVLAETIETANTLEARV